VFESVLVANRGEIARRIIRTVQRLGLRAVAVYSEADASLPFVKEADEAILLGAAAPAESYRNIDALLEAARASGAAAIHPGYGFLAENAEFARAVVEAGLVWIGPPPEAIEQMGDKIAARNLAEQAGMPVSRGTREPVGDAEAAVAAATGIGYPIMVKASAGGGGMGMAVAADEAALRTSYDQISAFAQRMFGDPDRAARALLPERAPCRDPGARTRRRSRRRARRTRLLRAAAQPEGRRGVAVAGGRRRSPRAHGGSGDRGRRGRGLPRGRHRRMPARAFDRGVRVPRDEHPAAGRAPGHRAGLRHRPRRAAAAGRRGQAGVLRPGGARARGARHRAARQRRGPEAVPAGPGRITRWHEPSGSGVRVDAGYDTGDTVTPFYDSLLAKLVVHGRDRAEAIERARAAALDFVVEGPKCNLPFLVEVLDSEEFRSGAYDTGIVGRLRA
jgi:acetyl-CoA carboxylase biotin carboxylase subunit